MKINMKFLTIAALSALIVLPAVAVAGGDHSTVNKSIRIDDNGTAGDVDSVNGSIRIGANAFVDSVESVNGSIKLGNDVTVEKGIDAVNGSITVEAGSAVGGNVETVNGGIRLEHAMVSGDIETINGQLRILQGSEVAGNVIVREPKGWWGSNNRRKPVRVEIGENVIVRGDLVFEHAVELKLHETARVGEIIGDEVEMVGSS